MHNGNGTYNFEGAPYHSLNLFHGARVKQSEHLNTNHSFNPCAS